MKIIYRLYFLFSLLSSSFYYPAIAQSSCGWQQGEMLTYSQNDWGDGSNAGGALLNFHFNSLYTQGVIVGENNTIRFTSASSVYLFLPAGGPLGVLTGSLTNPLTTSAGYFGGDVLALQMNVDFSDAGLLGGGYPLGDLVIHDFTLLPAVNGQTVRQFLATANTVLGGGSASITAAAAATVANLINESFLNGTPSQFAQEHLRKGWQQGEMLTYNQVDYGDGSLEGGQLMDSHFNAVYGGNPVTIGTVFLLRFTDGAAVFNFLPTVGVPGTLTGSLTNPLTSSAGSLAGQVLALRFNVDYSDAGHINGIIPFGDLVIHDVSSPTVVNGMSVREFLDLANTVLGEGSVVLGASDAASVTSQLNNAFLNGTPSQFAQEHLRKGWQQGEMLTYTHGEWGTNQTNASNLLNTDFGTVYFYKPGGVLEVGISGNAGFSIILTSGPSVATFLPTAGNPAALTGDVINPTTSSSGIFGGEVTTLHLNIDYNDAGVLTGTSDVLFGDLILAGLTTLPYAGGNSGSLSSLNGSTVRGVLALTEAALGGASSSFTFLDFLALLQHINGAFANGTPSQFAQEHLKKGWQQGDFETYSDANWGDASHEAVVTILGVPGNFSTLYAGTGLVVGDPFPGINITFDTPSDVIAFLPASGTSGVLSVSYHNPLTTSGGDLAGQVVALKLNVDFEDAGLINSAQSILFGDLVINDFSAVPSVNGMSVREFLDLANHILAGGSAAIGPSTTAAVASLLNNAFIDGTPSQFAKDHLISPCDVANHCPVATAASITTKLGTAINIQLQASDEDNDALSYIISQNALHGTVTTSASGAAIYTPTAGYYGADEFKFKADDGECDDEETVTITIVKCPAGKGNWINNPDNWPEKATPMLLGTQSYTKEQLLVILNTPVGTGQKADASLILAHQLIPAKLNEADGTDTPDDVSDAIEAADLLIGNNLIPMRVKPNTPLGQQMVSIAAFLETYNKALLTQACQPATVPVTSTKQQNLLLETSQPVAEALEARLYPNPSGSYFNIVINSNDSKERIVVQVFDQYGRSVDVRNNISNGSTVRLGDRYRPGVYYVRVLQGKQHKEIKLVKLAE